MQGVIWLAIFAHAVLSASAGAESCDGRIVSLKHEIARLRERLSLCLRERADFPVAANSSWATTATARQARTAGDEPTMLKPARPKRHATARRLLRLANTGQFAPGQAGTNECATGFSSLGSEAECEAAAAQLNQTFQGSEEATEYPKGCYAYPGEGVYFNKHATGAAEYDSMPVCADDSVVSKQSSAGIPTPPPFPGRFIRGECKTNVCPPGSVAIETVPECKRAAERLLLSYSTQANTPIYPKGCYVDVSRSNTHTPSTFFKALSPPKPNY